MSEKVIIRALPSKGRTQFGVYPNVRMQWGVTIDRFDQRVTGLSEQDEQELGKAMNVDLSKNSDFWKNFVIVLTNKEEVLDLDRPMDKLKYLVLKTKKQVAASKNDIKPYSIFYMFNEVEEANKEDKAFDFILTAYKYLADMTQEEMADFLKLFNGTKTHNLKPVVIKKKLKDLADANPELFVKFYEDKDKKFKIMFEDLIQKRIVKVKNGAYYHNEDMIGADLNLAITKVKNPKNQDLLLILKKKLEETPFE